MTLQRQEVKTWMGKLNSFLSSLVDVAVWQFQLDFAMHYGQEMLHQWPGHSPNLNLIENCWRHVPILPISFHSISSHSIPFLIHFPFQFRQLVFEAPQLPNELTDFDAIGVNHLHFQALYDTCQDIQNRSRNCWVMRSRRDLKLLSAPHCSHAFLTNHELIYALISNFFMGNVVTKNEHVGACCTCVFVCVWVCVCVRV